MSGALVELSVALVLARPIIVTAADWFASPNYKPDAYERRELVEQIDRWAAWEHRHQPLIGWAQRTGGDRAARVLGIVT